MTRAQELYQAGVTGARAIFDCVVTEAEIVENAGYDPVIRTITINSRLNAAEHVLALGHELAHIFQCSPSVEYPEETDDEEQLIRDLVSEVAAYRALLHLSVDLSEYAFPRICKYVALYTINFGHELPAVLPDSSEAQRNIAFIQRMIAIADGQVNGSTYPALDARFTRTLRITTNYIYYIFMLYQGVKHA